ncbi:hypothetical protein RclHR1_00310018 [Rhizophagus clarus]|uniref:Poly A polymerase head domain-containing protein n=1 Tax=Rhizophagus clarus TaxID=94130 RepID=A0A2Z6R732_9GLOM|nr:hypothetical protein RclHR1_00310018 [Rhizophagus clarus]
MICVLANNLVLIISGSSIMKRNFKFSKIFYHYHYRPFTIYSFVYKSNFAKVPSEPGSLRNLLQRHRPYSVNREVGEVKLGEVATSVGSTLSKNLPQGSLGLQKQSGKEMNIVLTEQESEVCNILRKVTAYLKETKQLPLVELRIAGGWVRDKLLQFECHDLDVAINSLTGSDFANYIKEFLDKEGDNNNKVKIHVIESNPEKSKHLETATTNLCGLDIDFVNLRKEVYEDSRIPVSLEYGTPEDDAYRRDITINALFYNIHTGQVEDFTKKGISDLREGLIRTPLPSCKTFKDDPLRVLRCIRFASRFHFKIVDDVKDVIVKDESIKVALNKKISRERVGIEIDKMIKGPDPVQAIDLIVNLGLYDVVFSPPPQENIVSGNLRAPKFCLIVAKILSWLLSNESKDYNVHTIFHQLNENEKRALYLAAYALPYKDMTYTEKGISQPVYQYVIRESIKFSNDDVNKIKKLLSSIDFVIKTVSQNNEVLTDRRGLGLCIRELNSDWPTTLLFALSNELIPKFEYMDQVKENKEIKEINNKYTKFIERIYELKLEKVYSEKHLLNQMVLDLNC